MAVSPTLSPTLTTVTGRVRATQRLKVSGADEARVVATSWASDRPFPRLTGEAVAFELEAGDGAVTRVEPFEAVVALPVRRADARAGVRHEEAWIAVGDEITVEGELEPPGRGRPLLRARRIVVTGAGAGAPHRLPPRGLARGDAEAITPPDTDEAADGSAVPRRPKKKRPDSSGTPTPAV